MTERWREGDVDLWYADIARMGHAALAACEDQLAPAERARAAAMATLTARQEHLVGRALLRTVLSRHAEVAPTAWRIEEDDRGKPFVAAPAGGRLSFNLSHAGGLVACAVTTGRRRVGVDIEDLRRKVDVLKVAGRFFAPTETRQLAALPPGEQVERFYALWTLREAYLKARGLGLALPLDQLEFRLDGPRPRLLYRPGAGDADATTRWDFWRARLAPAHTVALAVERTGDDDDDLDGAQPPSPQVRRFRRPRAGAARAV